MIPETRQQTFRRRFFLESGALARPHPLRNLPERLGRAPGRVPLPSVFEDYLRDQLERASVPPPSCSALLPSRDLLRDRRRVRTRRPDL